jgi:hypothetical protein
MAHDSEGSGTLWFDGGLVKQAIASNTSVHLRRRTSSLLIGFLCCLPLFNSSYAQSTRQLPRIEGDSFAGHRVVLPEAASGKVAVLIFGFTKASKVPTSAWADKLQPDFGTRPGFEVYQLPVLEDVPRFVRGMVISGIRKGVPENKRDHFVPILQGEAELKTFVGYKEPDDAYLVILDRAGNIVQQIHGAPNDSNYARVRSEIETLLNQR